MRTRDDFNQFKSTRRTLVNARAGRHFREVGRGDKQVSDHGEKDGNRAHLAIGLIDRQRKDKEIHRRQQADTDDDLVDVKARVAVLVRRKREQKSE